jgi:hypothetical protein
VPASVFAGGLVGFSIADFRFTISGLAKPIENRKSEIENWLAFWTFSRLYFDRI